MSRSWFDAFFGRLLNDGTELELIGGVNFVGFTITADTVNGYYTIAAPNSADNSIALSKLVNAAAQYDFIMRKTAGGGAWERGARADLVSAIDGQHVATSFGTPFLKIGASGSTFPAAGAIRGIYGSAWWAKTTGGTDSEIVSLRQRGGVDDCVTVGHATTTAKYIAEVKTGGVFERRVNGTVVVEESATQTDMKSRNLANVAKLDGATVAAPVEGAAVTTTATLTVAGGNNYVVSSAGGAYTITLGTGGSPYTGEVISLVCSAALANAITVANGGTGGGNIGPSTGAIPAAAKLVCDFVFDGTDWALAGVKRLA